MTTSSAVAGDTNIEDTRSRSRRQVLVIEGGTVEEVIGLEPRAVVGVDEGVPQPANAAGQASAKPILANGLMRMVSLGVGGCDLDPRRPPAYPSSRVASRPPDASHASYMAA